ncbi:MAG: GCN5-like N-acetyltransferase [Bacteroidota bacterium]|jgi:ElaA protein
MILTWHCCPFDELSLSQLYEIMQLRQRVFIVEQNCAYLDADDKDQNSHHLLGIDDCGLAAYARLLPPNLAYAQLNESSIGRVITHERVRRLGAGKALMQQAVAHTHRLFGAELPIRIGAQSYLLAFYSSFGFVSTGKEYLEDDIPHTEMVLGR